MKHLLCVHGWNGAPDTAWKPWLKKTAEEMGYQTFFPQMPNTEHPKKEEWLEAIHEIVKEPDHTWTLVGHSLGTPAILRFLETFPSGTHIRKVISIAGMCSHLPKSDPKGELHSFFNAPWNWQAIRGAAEHFTIIHSQDDDWVPVEKALELSQHLRVDPILEKGYKHFSTDDNVTEIPFLLQQL